MGQSYQNSSGGHAHALHQQQLLQQIQKQSSHHFVGSFGNVGGGTGPGSSHGNYYGSSNNEFLVESQKIIYAPPSREKSKQTVRSPMILEGTKASITGQYQNAEGF